MCFLTTSMSLNGEWMHRTEEHTRPAERVPKTEALSVKREKEKVEKEKENKEGEIQMQRV